MDTQLRSRVLGVPFLSPILLNVVHGVEEVLHGVVDEVPHLILGPVAVAFRVLGTVALARVEEVGFVALVTAFLARGTRGTHFLALVLAGWR